MPKSLIEEIGYDNANQLMAGAIARAAREASALGLPDVVKIDGTWCAKYPDGRCCPLSEVLAKDTTEGGR
ncbi:hypothetical protein NAV31_18060 [Pseudomonas stutzeri]|nr:hypothetical protein [Stutzerimonas degradans]